MIPFLYFDLKVVIRNLLDIVIQPVVIEACYSGKQFKETDLSKKGNLLPLSKVNLGLAVEKEINTLTKSDVATIQQVNKFRESVRDFVIEMLYKLFERNSLDSTLLRCASVFDPTCLLDMTHEKLNIRWKGFLKYFSELDFLSTQKCDKAMVKLKSFVGDIKSKFQAELQGFIRKVRLEKFYFEEINIQKYEKIAEVLKIALTLSFWERVFSHNNTVVQANVSADSLISKRLIKDQILFDKLKPYTIEITDPMIRAFKSSHLKYQLHLESEKKKKKNDNSETDRQLLHLLNDIDKLKTKVKQLENAITMMDDEAFECMHLAEEKSNLSYVIKGNGLKRKSEQSKASIAKLSK